MGSAFTVGLMNGLSVVRGNQNTTVAYILCTPMVYVVIFIKHINSFILSRSNETQQYILCTSVVYVVIFTKEINSFIFSSSNVCFRLFFAADDRRLILKKQQ